MIVADGRKIMIRFTQPLTGGISGNEARFRVSFDEYNMVPGGSLVKSTRQVVGLSSDYTSVDCLVDMQSGILVSTTMVDGELRLEEVT